MKRTICGDWWVKTVPSEGEAQGSRRKSLTSRPGPRSLAWIQCARPETLRIAPRERREFTFFMPKAALKFWTKKRRKVLASLNSQALKNQFFILKSKIKFITLSVTSTSSQLPALTQARTFFIPFESGVRLQVLETLSPQYCRGLTTCSALTPGRGLLTSFPWTLTDPKPSPLPSRNTDTRRSNKYTSACLKTFTCSLWTIKYIPNTPVEQHSKLLSYWALPTCPVLSLIALLNRPHSPGKLNSSSPPDTPFASCTRASALHFHPRRCLPSFCPARSGSDATISISSLLEIISPPSEQCAVKCPQWLSRIRLSVTPWTVARQAPLSTGFPRQEHWNGLPFLPPGDLPHPGIKPASPASPELADRFFTTAPPEKPLQSGVAFCFYPSWGSYHTDCATVSRELLKKFTP